MAFPVSEIVETICALLTASNKQKKLVKDFDSSAIEGSISYHLAFVDKWSACVPCPGLSGDRRLQDVFINLPLSLTIKSKVTSQTQRELTNTDKLLDTDRHIVLLGDPGAGKSTVVKKFCQHLIHNEPRNNLDRCNLPVVIRCRDLRGEVTLYAEILRRLGITVRADKHKKNAGLIERLVASLIDDNEIFLFVDGMDELPFRMQQVFVDQFQQLAYAISNGRLMLTCRSGAFSYTMDNALTVELMPLGNALIEKFALSWITDNEMRAQFLTQLKNTPYADTAVRPLTLAHMCTLFRQYGEIPDRPRTVYRRIVHLLLEDWDRENSVQRTSEYSRFGVERKADFLAAFAYSACLANRRGGFTSVELRKMYREICAEFELPRGESHAVVREIESHTGLIIQSGYREFEFAHLSIQEFLCADYLVRGQLFSIPRRMAASMPNEIAVATALASNSAEFFLRLVVKINQSDLEDKRRRFFFSSYVRRITIERPDFVVGTSLGLAVLIVLPWVTVDEAGALVPDVKTLREFCKLSAIKKSMQLVRQECKVTKTKESWNVYVPRDVQDWMFYGREVIEVPRRIIWFKETIDQ